MYMYVHVLTHVHKIHKQVSGIILHVNVHVHVPRNGTL